MNKNTGFDIPIFLGPNTKTPTEHQKVVIPQPINPNTGSSSAEKVYPPVEAPEPVTTAIGTPLINSESSE